MDQPEEVLEKLERFNVQKNPEITRELDEYVSFVARTGESVFNWALVKRLYREKLINVITEFNEASTKELPVYPNVDPFNYETMKKMLIERLDSFNAAPFTIQRISELLADPRKQYSRIDKFMRAVEKNILVVSTVSPGRNRSEESENGDSLDSVGLNGDFSSDVNVDIDMENENDGSFTMTKEFNATTHRKEGNHEIVAVTQETVTIKKAGGTKEEESSAPAIASCAATVSEPPQPTQTDITIETTSDVTITVCEPVDEAEPTVSHENGDQKNPATESVESSEQKSNNAEEEDESVIKASEAVAPIVSEPKIDEDALLNEPLRPADDEILVDTSETTPLAALENIVANRTVIDEVSRIEDQPMQKTDQSAEQQEASDEQEEQTSKAEVDESTGGKVEEESEIPAKRLKLDAEEDMKTDSVAEEVQEAENVVIAEVTEKPVEVTAEEAPIATTTNTPIVKEPSEEERSQQTQEEPTPVVAEETPPENVNTTSPVVEVVQPEIIEDAPVLPPISTVTADDVLETQQQQQPSAVVETQPEDAMESTPIVENQMALDEDVTTAAAAESSAAMDVTPLAANKMDTDNDGENALMDVDDDEPMDQ